ncbi:small GTP-binding protein [Alcanivorax hongdengensis A-11-3]|uniref:Small GTP-binding protein n=1 Tax=Alcanivorax hongdengensis A-11-3 TaxID=1177179 RepID=L0WDS6_9GAMM|nr:ATP-binding protein [Alcanivorax hongdengensis]EKF74968.1 small GTP-binding protein [Alcanivorax hongdengensis A-11-3]
MDTIASNEFKILFTGPMGAGKTTAISAISDQAAVSTDVINTDLDQCEKELTTAALDYGQIALPDGSCVRLYGTPGQERFRFMWPILMKNAAGVIVLLNGEHQELEQHLEHFVQAFGEGRTLPMVVGVGRLPEDDHSRLERLAMKLEQRGIALPIFDADVRKHDDVLLLVDALLCLIEANDTGRMEA